MSKSADEHIPSDILQAARRAGLREPLWYVGRANGHEKETLERDLNEVIERAYEEAGEPVPERIDLPPRKR